MADVFDREKRSKIMSRIKSRDTKPEMQLRSALHKRGLRFRLHRNDLPGRPDIVFPRQRLAIQVRGCFWHVHQGCRYSGMPKTNSTFWEAKLRRNVARDLEKDHALRALGWRLMVVWECEMRTRGNADLLAQQIELSLDR